jgi:putative ABC transport system ATP-binding protein
MVPSIEATGIVVNAGQDIILAEASLAVNSGEYVALKGENGSGKSTFLNVITGRGFQDRAPEQGEVLLNGVSVWTLSKKDRRELRSTELGYVSQVAVDGLLPGQTVAKNLVLSANGRKQKVHKDRLDEVVDYYGFGEFMKRNVGRLSGGQRQLLAIMKAEVTDPGILVMDEPMAALSEGRIAQVEQRLLSLAQISGKLIIEVSHQSKPAATRIVHFEHGKIVNGRPLVPRTSHKRSLL